MVISCISVSVQIKTITKEFTSTLPFEKSMYTIELYINLFFFFSFSSLCLHKPVKFIRINFQVMCIVTNGCKSIWLLYFFSGLFVNSVFITGLAPLECNIYFFKLRESHIRLRGKDYNDGLGIRSWSIGKTISNQNSKI